jgi:hypothetical protein
VGRARSTRGLTFPDQRPTGLRRRRVAAGTRFWRFDDTQPSGWTWTDFPVPRHRFDPASGRFRTRYANDTVPGAARERYDSTGRYIPSDHAGHFIVALTTVRSSSVLDLRTEANLDVLGLDDRISTSHDDDIGVAAHELADAVRRWWGDLDGLLYRPRTTPTSSVNLAFFSTDGLALDTRPLARAGDELDDLVLRHHFTIGFDY